MRSGRLHDTLCEIVRQDAAEMIADGAHPSDVAAALIHEAFNLMLDQDEPPEVSGQALVACVDELVSREKNGAAHG